MEHALVVVDDDTFAHTLSRLLEDRGLAVHVARDIGGMKQLMLDVCFDIIFIDSRLPDGTGVEALRFLKDVGFLNPVVITSDEPSVDEAQICLREGVFDYLLKPIAEDELGGVLERALESLEESRRECEIGLERAIAQKRLEMALQKSKQELEQLRMRHAKTKTHFEQFFESMCSGVILLDERGVVLDVNPIVESMAGVSREELLGMGYAELLELPDHLSSIDALLRCGDAVNATLLSYVDVEVEVCEIKRVGKAPIAMLLLSRVQ